MSSAINFWQPCFLSHAYIICACVIIKKDRGVAHCTACCNSTCLLTTGCCISTSKLKESLYVIFSSIQM